jgi:hypothetical protein
MIIGCSYITLDFHRFNNDDDNFYGQIRSFVLNNTPKKLTMYNYIHSVNILLVVLDIIKNDPTIKNIFNNIQYEGINRQIIIISMLCDIIDIKNPQKSVTKNKIIFFVSNITFENERKNVLAVLNNLLSGVTDDASIKEKITDEKYLNIFKIVHDAIIISRLYNEKVFHYNGRSKSMLSSEDTTYLNNIKKDIINAIEKNEMKTEYGLVMLNKVNENISKIV